MKEKEAKKNQIQSFKDKNVGLVYLSGNSLILNRQNSWIHSSSNAKSLTADSKQPIFHNKIRAYESLNEQQMNNQKQIDRLILQTSLDIDCVLDKHHDSLA